MFEPESSTSSQQVQVDMNKVFASYSRQVSEQAHKIAVQEAIIETQQEEIKTLRELIDSVPATIDERPKPQPTKRTTPKKEK